ncbi:hypothetical protein [Streptomyces coeruleorubidus]|uniref:hypothetical protein n=1 Tax=Streptomyces coeruleorubidus TaxID=116188 RepID=UPI0033BE6C45
MTSPGNKVALEDPKPTPDDERQKRLDENLATVAKLLIAAFVGVAGVGTAFGLSQDSLLVAINNDLTLYVWVAALSIAAVALGIASLFCSNNAPGNRIQAGLLTIGSVFYIVALLLVINGVAKTATGNGRPSITDVTVKPNSMAEVSFTVHADGVQKGKMVVAEVQGFKNEAGQDILYRTLLRPDDTGDVHQKVTFVYKRGVENWLTIRAQPDGTGMDGEDCDANQAPSKLGCATVRLPEK